MTSEFNWWLLIVGIVVGAGLTWLVLADLSPVHAPEEAEETELQLEADWIAARFAEQDRALDTSTLTEALRLDRLYRTPGVRLAPTRVRRPRPSAGTAVAADEDASTDEQAAEDVSLPEDASLPAPETPPEDAARP
jgi:hypothetical protein